MWTCLECQRIFKKTNQRHSCRKIPLEKHFLGKEKARKLFDFLVKEINDQIGKCKIISIPCCIHLFGKYDFLALLPKKDRLEIRFALGRKLHNSRLKQTVPMSLKVFKNRLDVFLKKEINKELIGWLKESYYLKN